MYLSEIFIENFRIFGAEEDGNHLVLNLRPGLNVLVGENDSGKSAIVDAIRHVLWTTSNEYHRLTVDDFHVSGSLIPPEWRNQWNLKVILRGENTTPDPSGNFFLTNIQHIYGSRENEWTPSNAVDALLGKKPVKDLSSHEVSMLERIKGLRDLVMMNDEAHHVHDEDLEWSRTILGIHDVLPSGLSLWLDFSATPKNQNGTYFPWIICDYPLAQAVEDRIVKAPLIVHQIDRKDPDKVSRKNVIEAYGDWLLAALTRWKEHYKSSIPIKGVTFLLKISKTPERPPEISTFLQIRSR